MIALALLALQAPAAMAPAEPAPAIAPAQRALAEELVRVAGVDATMHAAIDRQIAQLRTGAQLSAQLDANPAIRAQRAKNPQAWDAAIARIAARQADAFAVQFAELQPIARARAVEAYAANFTPDELRRLTAFYRTPLGRTLVAKTPAISEETTAWLQQELPRRLAATIQALAPAFQRELAPLLPPPAPPAPPR